MKSPSPLEVFLDPCVVTAPRAGGARLDADLPFEIQRWISLGSTRGRLFTAATGDPNPLHTRRHGVVPGAFLVAECLASLEVLFPQLHPQRIKFSFTRVARYGERLELLIRGAPAGERVCTICRVLQAGQEVARGTIVGAARSEPSGVDAASVSDALDDFCVALGVAPGPFLERAGPGYPLSFLCALPSGQLVRELGGEGGMLNRLTFEVSGERVALAETPRVELGLPTRARASFNRIAVEVHGGSACALSGAALVLPKAAAPSRALAC